MRFIGQYSSTSMIQYMKHDTSPSDSWICLRISKAKSIHFVWMAGRIANHKHKITRYWMTFEHLHGLVPKPSSRVQYQLFDDKIIAR